MEKLVFRVSRTMLAIATVFFLRAACGGDDDSSDGASNTTAGGDTGTAANSEPVTLRLGYFPNLTHAPALVGVQNGIFEENLASNVTLETFTFNAGPEAVTALFSDALDITYIGPNPAINAFAESNGEAIRIIAGSTSGGAALVVRDGIDATADLAGKTLATPQLGNTQDVALRSFLADEGFATDVEGGGDVSIAPQANSDALTAFVAGDIDGAWVPEPWVTRMVNEGNGHVLVNEADLWPNGQFVTTHVIVRTAFLEDHPDVVRQFLAGHLASLDFIHDSPDEAMAAANEAIGAITDKPLAADVLASAWANLEFTADPIASSLQTSAENAEAVGLLDPVDLNGIYDLTILNELLAAAGEAEVTSP
jgi:NitT/TauT family transport system substrate-binding protein